MTQSTPLALDGNSLTLADVRDVAVHRRPVMLSDEARARMLATRAVVADIVQRNDVVYGVTTGFGKLSDIGIPADKLAQLQVNLLRSHVAGVGPELCESEARAMMLLRANVMAKGFSGARPDLPDLVCAMLNADLWPVVPEQGSVGASGDLAPLAALAVTLIGEGMLHTPDGRLLPAAEALKFAKLHPVTLAPKEGLTLINGTQAHTAVAALAVAEARALWEAAHVAGAMSLEALKGTPTAFDVRIHDARGQDGQSVSAALLRTLLHNSPLRDSHRDGDPRVQDAYALRCMPQVHGPVLDAIRFAEGLIGRELNAATDNPLVFANGELLSGGNFHGQAVAMALDVLAIAMTNLASISERRIDRLVHPDLNEDCRFLGRGGAQQRLHDGAGLRRRARQRVQGAVASGERGHHSHRRQQGRRRADGDGGSVETAPHHRQRASRDRHRANVRRAGARLPPAAAQQSRGGARP
jgi:histidine ammonia-lyase